MLREGVILGLLVRWLTITGLHVHPPPSISLLGPLYKHMRMSHPVKTPVH